MSRNPVRQSDPAVLAVLHRAGQGWSALVANVRGSSPQIIDSRIFEGSDHQGLSAWVDRHLASEVVLVLPAGTVICRTCPLPLAEPEQLEQALDLQAEAHLGGVPPHRTARTVLQAAPGETSRTGIVVAWPQAAVVEIPKVSARLSFAPDVAGLAGLLNGERPAEPIVWANRRDGSIALALTHGSGAVFRATREDGRAREPWLQSVGQALAETALNAGHTAGFVESIVERTRSELETVDAEGARLVMPEELRRSATARIQGARDEAGWWSQYGIAVGVLLARTGPLEALTHLVDQPPVDRPNPLQAITAAAARPRTAVNAAMIAALVIVLAPLIFQRLRLEILEMRHAGLEDRLAQVNEVKRIKVMYQELGQHSWTMTKLLADLACSTPEKIDLESIRIQHGESINVSGTATSNSSLDLTAQQVVALMQKQLEQTNIFASPSLEWEKTSNIGGYEFRLNAGIREPHLRFEYPREQDYGDWTLAERLYGEVDGEVASERAADPAPTAVVKAIDDPVQPAAEPEQVATAPPDDGPRTSGSRGGRRPNADAPEIGGIENRNQGVRAPMDDIPPALTKEQVDPMSREEVTAMLARIGKARRTARSSGDSELEERLANDFQLLLQKLRSFPQ